MKPLIIAFFIALAMISYSGYSQDVVDTTSYEVETKDGNIYLGQILFENDSIVRLRTTNIGDITIQRKNIKSIVQLKGGEIIDGQYWFENPQASRYFWQPNGYGLKKGEAYYQNIWIFWNQVSVGFSDYFSAGAGIVPLFLFGGAPTPVWITPKFSIPVVRDKFNIGTGALMGTVLGEDETGFGILYGVTTFGSKDKNFSIGLGYGYAGGDWADAPTITFSGMVRTGENGYFITENYFIGTAEDNILLLSLGGRRMVRRVGIDAAVVIPTGFDGDLIVIPILGLTVPFGNVPGNRNN
jgi:hypothetical protein